MISKITLSNINSFIDKVELTNLTRLNFFYGSNGSGKSTLAKVLFNESLTDSQKDLKYKNCQQVGFNRMLEKILVFDERFVEKNFVSANDFPGVFSLNEGNSIIDGQIENLQKDYSKIDSYKQILENRVIKINRDLQNKYNELKNSCWDERDSFYAFHEIELEHSKNKENHLTKIKAILPVKGATSGFKIENLLTRYSELYNSKLTKIDLNISLELFKQIKELDSKIIPLMEEVIDTNKNVDIAELIDALGIRKWVDEGRKYTIEGKENICPFCQHETFDEDLKERFKTYFDEAYKKKIDELETLKNQYFILSKSFLDNIFNVSKVFNKDNKTSDLHKQYSDLIADNILLFERKIKLSNEIIEFYDIENYEIELDKINDEIEENNEKILELDTNKEKLINDIWLFMAEKCVDEIQEFDERTIKAKKLISHINTVVKGILEEQRNINSLISELKSKTVSTDESVKKINSILSNCGFNNFKIVEKENTNNISRYYLKRDNDSSENVFKTLSEGEKNFVAFLYFYQLVLGTDDKELKSFKKIVVIDDPVSSLDSQVLFIVSTIIHKIIEQSNSNKKDFKNSNICQVFVLTHNVYFYKEVSFEKRPICKDCGHYFVSKLNKNSNIEHKGSVTFIHNDYTLLWKTIKQLKTSSERTFNVTICNSMRRIIESYVNFVGIGHSDWDSLKNLDVADPIYPICSALISELNDSSHKVSPLDDLYYQRIVNEEPIRIYSAFELIFKNIGEEHYKMMMN
jgi:wobble nucleotide-excising tRNase